MKKITYEFLKSCCTDESSFDSKTKEPHHVGNMWVATDRFFVVSVNDNMCDDNIPIPNIVEFVPFEKLIAIKGMNEYIIQFSDIINAFDSAPKVDEVETREIETKFENCTACDNGNVIGYVKFRGEQYEYNCPCPVCLGTGKVPVSEKFNPYEDDATDFVEYEHIQTGRKVIDELCAFEINEKKFYYKYLKKLKDIMDMLEEDSVTVSFNDKSHYMVCKMNNACIVISELMNCDRNATLIKTTEKL